MLFVLRTFSKMLSIPSLRLGVIMSSSENIRYINNYKPHYTVNSIALLFAEAIVDNHDRLITELKKQYLEGKDYINKALAENGYETLPSEGCYICIKSKVQNFQRADRSSERKKHTNPVWQGWSHRMAALDNCTTKIYGNFYGYIA